jgi:hypothetical protein
MHRILLPQSPVDGIRVLLGSLIERVVDERGGLWHHGDALLRKIVDTDGVDAVAAGDF